MQVSKQELDILVEGEDNSSELAFFKRSIRKIITDNGLSIIPNVIEVGSRSAFASYAQLGYRYSKIYQSIPVLAIADSICRVGKFFFAHLLSKDGGQEKDLGGYIKVGGQEKDFAHPTTTEMEIIPYRKNSRIAY